MVEGNSINEGGDNDNIDVHHDAVDLQQVMLGEFNSWIHNYH